MDETTIKVKVKGNGYIYIEALINSATPLILCFPNVEMKRAATAFFKQVIDANGFPRKVVLDKSRANYVGLENIYFLLMPAGLISFVEILQEG